MFVKYKAPLDWNLFLLLLCPVTKCFFVVLTAWPAIVHAFPAIGRMDLVFNNIFCMGLARHGHLIARLTHLVHLAVLFPPMVFVISNEMVLCWCRLHRLVFFKVMAHTLSSAVSNAFGTEPRGPRTR